MKLRQRVKNAFLQHAVQPVAVRAITTVERIRTGVTYNPLDRRYRVDPYPFYRRLRERDPFHRSRLVGGWVLTRYEDASAVLRDPRCQVDERKMPAFEPRRAQMVRDGLVEEGEDFGISMLRSDPPDHTRLRSLVSKAFTPRTVEALRPRIEAIVNEQLDAVADTGGMDVIAQVACPLPVTVIAEMLGVPIEDRDQFKRWSDDAVRALGVGTLDDFRASRAASQELRAYFEGIAEQRRREPREDVLSALLAAEEEGDKLSTDEVFSMCILLLVAGNETTTNLIGNGLLALLHRPDQLALLRDDPALIEPAVEELLRFDSPVQGTTRFFAEETEINGHVVPPWQQIVVVLAAANRDPARFADPERLDITRADNQHLSLSHGIHYCLGAPLARLEAQVALLALIERFPRLRLATESQVWGDNLILRGLKALPVAF
jgi:cytochrome P450